jgi:chromosome segregation ATPase
MSELKKRMHLVKWRGEQIVCRAMQSKYDALGEQVEKLKEELADANDKVTTIEAEDEAYAADLESALVDVKYWLLDWLHHRFNIGPRELLRKVEDALG